MNYYPHHKFHIPVMGLAYTIDSPVKVARFGISSVISIIEDRLVEMMRAYYYPVIHQAYKPITTKVENLRKEVFETGSEIVKYFEMLPGDSNLKKLYCQMVLTEDFEEKEK